MCFHAGGINESKADRRGINHVFTIPYIKQQITLPLEMKSQLNDFEKGVLGFKNLVPDSIEAFLNSKKEAE
jgi:ectoine hydroxylase-related dioxygenase (phytanoyl-CoA dioxygenase family)